MKKIRQKWAIALVPLALMGCTEQIVPDEKPGTATSGDEVLFSITKNSSSSKTRTVYEDQWDEKNTQDIYWGNYTDAKEYINIYCPDNPGRGFAKYEITKDETDKNVAATVVKISEIGVQWGSKGPHTFYAFYPADKAGETLLDGRSTIRATIDNNQSPLAYKQKENSADYSELKPITSFKEYAESQYKETVQSTTPRSIYGMPDMNAAVMVARTSMTEEEYGNKVPLQFNVLADVLDLTFHGPVTPNTLGGNASGPTEGIQRPYIQIQSVTIDVVDPTSAKNVADYKIDNDVSISGNFDLDMSQEVAGTADMVKNVSGTSTIQLITALSNENEGTYYPTLYVRSEEMDAEKLDHLRLRCFLIPGQIKPNEMGKLRVHIQTDCGEFYQMLENDPNASFASGQIYPVKFGHFKARGADFDLAAWIGQLNPNIYLSELSIPGAWHSANTDYQGDVSLKELYDAGIRAFEVHSINGTIPYTDNTFKTELTTDNVNSMEFHDTHLNEEVINQSSFTVDGGKNEWNSMGTQVTGTDKTVTETRTIKKYDMLPKLYLRLYRTSNITNDNNPENSMSDAIIDLAKTMTSTGFIFLEFGWDDGGLGRSVSVPMKTVTVTQKRTKTGVTLTGRGAFWTVTNWNTDGIFNDTDPWETTIETPSYSKKEVLSSKQAWCIAINSCINRLKNTVNPTTQKTIIYEPEITAETTISDVQGRVIFKVNTNNNENEGSMTTGIGWEENTPALFSRWIQDSHNDPKTINLQWGMAIAPYDQGDTGQPNSNLRWCFTEIDNISDVSSIEKRQEALKKMNTTAANNYAGGLHRTFYESMFGGFAKVPGIDKTTIAQQCQYVAKEMNTFVLNRLSDPTRQNVPLGLTFMNYAIAPKKAGSTTEEEEGYNSAALIRAIINNNKAFLLHRRDANSTASNVEENTNSHFNNNSQNPLK